MAPPSLRTLAALVQKASSQKKIDGSYHSGPCRAWIKVRNPTSIAVQRERSEI
jgi:hypothetical protein